MSEQSVQPARRALRPPSVAGLEQILAALGRESTGIGQAERIDRIAALERLKGAVAAAQARERVAFKQSRVEADRAAGVTARKRGIGVGNEVALARRESPNKGSRLPVAFMGRGKKAETDRHVSGRAAPDTMSRISALLPATQGWR